MSNARTQAKERPPSVYRLAIAAVFAVLIAFTAGALADNIERNVGGYKIHWSDGAGGGPGYVTLVDHTGPRWPVYAAAIEWDYAGHLNVIYRADDCGGNGHCVGVNNYKFEKPCGEVGGKAILVYPLFGWPAHLDSDTEVDLNQRCADDVGEQYADRDRRVITCQEEGHVMGLDHDYAAGINNTCMAAHADEIKQATNKPRQHDFVQLDDVIYDHRD